MNYLITDLNIQLNGHKFGFINNLLLYAEKLSNDNQFYFLTNNSEDFELKSEKEHIRIIKLSEVQTADINAQKRASIKYWTQWKYIKSISEDLKIDKVILLEFDLYQIGIALTRFKFSVSGIWFRPYHRMQPENQSIQAKLNYFKHLIQKKATFIPSLLNPGLKEVFVLNDENVKSYFGLLSKKLFYLPDPVFCYEQEENFDLRKKFKIPDNNLILLQFGHMEERKNNENIIKALKSIPSEIAKNITLLLVGEFVAGYEQKIKSMISEDTGFQLITYDQYISDQEMEATFAQSDVILRMNLNFFGSSGVVGIAAAHQKPVIVSNNGVMHDQVMKYGLGKSIAPEDTEGIKNAILDYYNFPEKRKINGIPYLNSHSAEAYAKTLFGL